MQLDSSLQLVDANSYHIGDTIWLLTDDQDQNLLANVVETIQVTLTDSITGDMEVLTLTETGANTGVFVVSISSNGAASATANDGLITAAQGSELTASYTDIVDGTDTTVSAVLVDPYGVVFDSITGALLDGVSVSIVDATTGLPAPVFGDDGVSTYPSTVVTGGTATDGAGTVYNFPPGTYRFPYVGPGSYRFIIGGVPTGYGYPTVLTNTQIQNAPGAPYALVPGSRGEIFLINPGPAMHIDIPMDPLASNLFLRKEASVSSASRGDFVTYKLTLNNTSLVLPTTSTTVTDVLPQGFRFVKGSGRFDGATVTPTVAADGRTLTFNLGAVAINSSSILQYVTEVTAGARVGQTAVNVATVNAVQGASGIISNTAKASVLVRSDFMADRNILVGRVFVDDGQSLQLERAGLPTKDGLDDGEKGVPGVRVFLENGTYVVTDKDGLYHFDNVAPGTHVLQLDLDSLPTRFEILPLPNTRFAGRAFSQFVDLRPGTLWRANFRVSEKPPPSTPVQVRQVLQAEDDDSGLFSVILRVDHDASVPMDKLTLYYAPPEGWSLLNNTVRVDGEPRVPEQSMLGLNWDLDPSDGDHTVAFSLQPGGNSGDKSSIAYARFSSANTPKGRTELARASIQDRFVSKAVQRNAVFTTNFESFGTDLTEGDQQRLADIAEQLRGLDIDLIHAIGHTDDKPLRSRVQHVYKNNIELSQARALSVLRYLAKELNLPPEAIVATGRGELEPIADNKTKEGRAQNRRVELRIFANEVQRNKRSQVLNATGDGAGIAIASWESVGKSQSKKNEVSIPKTGLLSLTDGALLANRINAVRIALPTRLKPRLWIDDKLVENDRIGFSIADPKTGNTLYSYIGVDFGAPGEHSVLVEGMDPFGNPRETHGAKVHRTGTIAAIRFVEAGDNVADGKTPISLRVQLLDSEGRQINSTATLQIRGGELVPYQSDDLSTIARSQTDSRLIKVDQDGWMRFEPTERSGSRTVVLGFENAEEKIDLYIHPEYRDWILVGLAEGTVGYNMVAGNVKPLDDNVTDDKYYENGHVAFYAKGRIKGRWLLTAAIDTAKNEGYNKSLTGAVDPDRYYTIYGDTTLQQNDAPSSEKLYLKIEKDAFYALFGDYTTNLSYTELGRYNRTLSGLKSEYKGASAGYNLFASQTSQTQVHDEIYADGTSGLYRLSRQNILPGTDRIVIETRDRFQNQLLVDRIEMQRYVDYDIDYVAGTLYFKHPVPTQDENFNPVVIVVDYESDDPTMDRLTTAGGRGYLRPSENSEVGLTVVSEETLGKTNRLSAIDATIDVATSTKVRGEFARSSGQDRQNAQAYLIEGIYTGNGISGKAFVRETQNDFGVGQAQGSEDGTRKYGIEGRYDLDQRLRVDAQAQHQEYLATTATRDLVDAKATYSVNEGDLFGGVRHVADVNGAGADSTSDMITVGGRYRANDKLTLNATHEQLLDTGENSPDYPTRTLVGAEYEISRAVSLYAQKEVTVGTDQDTNADRVGLRANPWSGAEYFTTYEQKFDENGTRSFANFGLNQKWQLSETWSVDAGLDRSQTLRHPGTTGLSTNVPIASGDRYDYTATSLGANYNNSFWEFSARVDVRIADNERKYGRYSTLIGDLGPHLTAMGRVVSTRTEFNSGIVNDSGVVSAGLAWRPTYDGYVWFDRFDVKYDESIGGGSSDFTNWRYINNLNLNVQHSRDLQYAVQWGIKYVANEVAGGTTNSGITNLLGLQSALELKHKWDWEVHARMLDSFNSKTAQDNLGTSLGFNFAKNVWLSFGYNFSGFYDRDFSAAEFTSQGPFLRLRMKFDQSSLRSYFGIIK